VGFLGLAALAAHQDADIAAAVRAQATVRIGELPAKTAATENKQ
jgi:hypothetical protein